LIERQSAPEFSRIRLRGGERRNKVGGTLRRDQLVARSKSSVLCMSVAKRASNVTTPRVMG
jgi:hypothetical protein